MNLNTYYRNGGDMNENEPHVWDAVDFFARAARDPRVISNQLREMRCPQEDIFAREEEE